jgi:hypothetical protein
MIEQMYQEIGQAALSVAEGVAGKVLVYAEVEDGAISCDEFYVDGAGTVQFRLCPKPMKELIYSFWEKWKEQPGNREWRATSYVIEGGKFGIDLKYPDQINPNQSFSERRPLVVKERFGDMKVDYSKPRGS